MNELKGIVHYVYLLQSSIEYYSHIHPLPNDVIVYRGLESGGTQLRPLYHSMIGEVIVWSSFASTSLKQESAIADFITDEDSILFEISLHPGDTAARISDHSSFTNESEILIAASSGFMVESVEMIDISKQNEGHVKQLTIPLVKLIYCMSWYDFDIDERPATILV
jgi:hypothetical protein